MIELPSVNVISNWGECGAGDFRAGEPPSCSGRRISAKFRSKLKRLWH